ncbi:MAG TPA: hypothetical protein VFZ53_34305 [Polyangiaceae bacterium]
MTFDDSPRVDDDVLRELVRDGERAAPAGARARVLARLGVAAAAGAAAVTHATTATASAGAAATHSASPVAGTALGLGLAKVLVAHPALGILATLAVGAGAGIAAYQLTEPARPAVSAASARNETAEPRAALSRDSGAAAAGSSKAPALPAELLAAPSEPSPALRTSVAAQASAGTGPPAPSARLAPAPDLPASARLAEQQAMLDQARGSLRRGDGAGALAIVSGHEALYPSTEFAEERRAIRILSLVMLGRNEEARRHAERFELQYPKSLFLPSIRRSLGGEAEPSSDAESMGSSPPRAD